MARCDDDGCETELRANGTMVSGTMRAATWGEEWLYGFFLAAIVLDVGGAFGLKYASALLVAAYLLLYAGRIWLPVSLLYVELTLFAAAPALLLALSVARFHVPVGAAVGGLLFLSTWIVFPLLLRLPREKIVSFFTTSMYWGAILTLAAFVVILGMYLAGRLDLVARVNELAYQYNLGYFGQRPGTGGVTLFVPNVYFRWTMLLIPAIACLAAQPRRLSVVLAAVVATLSTAAIAFALAGLVLGLLVDPRTPVSRFGRVAAVLLVVAVSGVALAIASGLGPLLLTLVEKFTSSSDSTSIKLGHIQSIMELVSGDAWLLLFGTGVGSSFYTVGFDEVVSNVEVSHFNMLRQFGVVYTLAFFAYVAWVTLTLFRTDVDGRRLSVGIAMLFVAAGTNPLLLTPVFFLALVMGRAYVVRFRRETAASRLAPSAT